MLISNRIQRTCRHHCDEQQDRHCNQNQHSDWQSINHYKSRNHYFHSDHKLLSRRSVNHSKCPTLPFNCIIANPKLFSQTTVTTTLAPVTTSFTASTTITSTTTLTATVEQPAATFYAACGPSNLLSRVYDSVLEPTFGDPNGYLSSASVNPSYYDDEGELVTIIQTTLVADNAYDCCVQCITNPNCGGGFFQEDDWNQCTLSTPVRECDPTALGGVTAVVDREDSTFGTLQVTVFDGNCGLAYQGYPAG